MARKGFNDIEKIIEWARATGRLYYSIVNGQAHQRGKIFAKVETEDNLDDAMTKLADRLEEAERVGGTYTLNAFAQPSMNSPYTTFVNFASSPAISGRTQEMGIYGGNIAGYVATEISKEREKWQLEDKIKELERERDSTSVESVLDKCLIFCKALGINASSVGPLVASFIKKPQSSQPIQGRTKKTTADSDTPPVGLQEAINNIYQIEPQLGDIPTLLNKIAAYAKANPDQAANLINMIPS